MTSAVDSGIYLLPGFAKKDNIILKVGSLISSRGIRWNGSGGVDHDVISIASERRNEF